MIARALVLLVLLALAPIRGARADNDDDAVQFRIPLAELGLTREALAHSESAVESVRFEARADHVLTAAELELPLALADGESPEVQGLAVSLNGEPAAELTRAELARGARRVVLDARALASSNVLTLRLLDGAKELGCAGIAPGSFRVLEKASLLLTSLPLPLPNELGALPLPFFDPAFDRGQVLHFALSAAPSREELVAASSVAGWFALQGRGRLSFEAHLGSLPERDAVVFVADRARAFALGLTPPADKSVAESALELRAHPLHPTRKLLIVWGLGAGGLERAARALLAPDAPLAGALASAPRAPAVPALAPYEVPRWAPTRSTLTLAQLAGDTPLRVAGGRAQTLLIPFRLAPDLFAWPARELELELGYTQGISPERGPASLHVALNGQSVGVLPSRAEGRVRLRAPRDALRGYNELLLQVSYPHANAESAQNAESCERSNDPRAWVALAPSSRLELGSARRFAVMPDLGLFLYDGFPFTAHGDLRETSIVLPSRPAAGELATLLGVVAHFASITGHGPSRMSLLLGAPEPAALAHKDVLLIAAKGRHPLLATWSSELPLDLRDPQVRAQHPASASWLSRILRGELDDGELARAAERLGAGPFAAVMGLRAPWDAQRSVVVITASELAQMPTLELLLGHATSTRAENDLLLVSGPRRALFQLGAPSARGALPFWLGLRFWLARYFLLLLPLLLGAALAFSAFSGRALSSLARARLGEEPK